MTKPVQIFQEALSQRDMPKSAVNRISYTLLDIPIEILTYIFSFEPMRDMSVVSRFVCRDLRRKIPCDKEIAKNLCWRVAARGYLTMLQWARANKAPWDERVCAHAAAGGHLDILRWARSKDAPWTVDVCANAAKRGHFEVLKWAKGQSYTAPWNELVPYYAAKAGNIEMFRWAVGLGCGFSWRVCSIAALHGHFDILEWFWQNEDGFQFRAERFFQWAKAKADT
ncbi:MAG: ankyrin repeat domain-containing protein, partial [Parachlamydia sp.]|nr:ankyrin repeat domain-containing protein [Parachlamydia sp.]